MEKFWRSQSRLWLALLFCLCMLNLNSCFSLNDEGVILLKVKEKVVYDPHGALSNWNDEVGVENPCSWFGVGCSEGYVVLLNLKDLCLRGTLAADIGDLVHLKSIVLRNNSFSGVIPEEITNLKELEVLDLGCNNFSGHVPSPLGNNFSMTTLLLDNNELLHAHTHPEIYELQRLSELQVDEHILSNAGSSSSCNELFTSWNAEETVDVGKRKLLQDESGRMRRFFFPPPLRDPTFPSPSPTSSPSPLPSPSPSPLPSPSPSPVPFQEIPSTPNGTVESPPSVSTPAESPAPQASNSGVNHRALILSASIGGPVLLLVLVAGLYYWKSVKVSTVKPWATGLSGQLQRAFVSGVPKLKRAELEAACEDFSNVIGTLSVCTLYKGTLSSGVEIAVASIAAASGKDWSTSLESQFRKKVDTLSKVSHKNFISLLGYCVEEEPFTRMMVFEYAPNGTLFEHIHIKESEHLDWLMRLRIAMGMSYCLEHMHQLSPPLAHRNLTSSSVYLTEDYAAKISDFIFLDDNSTSERERNLQYNVYSFGVVLFEIITGKLPYSAGTDSLEDWASTYLTGDQPLRDMVDPTLRSYGEEQLQQIGDLIRLCAAPDPRNRPSMKEVSARLREISGIQPDGAVPRLSPLWWAELEILSTEATS